MNVIRSCFLGAGLFVATLTAMTALPSWPAAAQSSAAQSSPAQTLSQTQFWPRAEARQNGPNLPIQGQDAPSVRMQGVWKQPCQACNLTRVNFHRFRISDSDFTAANFTGARLTYATISRSRFNSANFTDADLSHADLGAGRFDRANFTGARMSFTIASVADLTEARFNRATLAGARFIGAVLRRASFTSAIGAEVSFVRADMNSARLENAQFPLADFTGADLRNANLTGADLSGANLAGARNLTQRQIDRACGDAATTLPGRVVIRRCAPPNRALNQPSSRTPSLTPERR
jgi:uncharacterized protein YjbI with pentapeptide repeats